MTQESTEQSPDNQQQSSLPLIYIVGNSHSGSTLLGFLLTANPNIVNLGELKGRTWLKDRFCSCGHPVAECEFYEDYFTTFNSLKKNVVSKIRNTKPVLFFFKKNISLDKQSSLELKEFYTSLSQRIVSIIPNATYMVDTSKSVSLLNAWLNILPGNQIKIIHLKRHTSANVSSFVKRGLPFLRSLISIFVNNWIINRYLKRNKLDYLEVDYNRFYASYADEAKAMSAFIGEEIPSMNRVPVHHHVIGGNNRTKSSFTNKVAAIHNDEEWKLILTGFQKKILRLLS